MRILLGQGQDQGLDRARFPQATECFDDFRAAVAEMCLGSRLQGLEECWNRWGANAHELFQRLPSGLPIFLLLQNIYQVGHLVLG
jgi:hypothetical protein